MRAVKDSLATPLEGKVGKKRVKWGKTGRIEWASCARATRTLGRCSLDARSGRPTGHPSVKRRQASLEGSSGWVRVARYAQVQPFPRDTDGCREYQQAAGKLV